MSERKHLLWIVDDSATERAMILNVLGNEFRCEQFTDGSEVVERLATGAMPDALLLDWVMPGMSGDEVCRYVRAQPHTYDLPVILVTSSRIETLDIVEGLRLGANDYVPKPFADEELRARVRSVLRAKEHREAAQRERTRLDAINRLGRALFAAGTNVPSILHELLASLTGLVADGCAITVLPGELPEMAAARHRADPSATELSAIATLADPGTFAFASDDEALARLPPQYHGYIRRFGLRGLAILPFPILTPIQGVVTLTRDRAWAPFDAEDLSTIETCIEYASLAVQNATRFITEREARTQLDAILANAPLGIISLDPAGMIKLTNPAARRMMPGIEAAVDLREIFGAAEYSTLDGVRLLASEWEPPREARKREISVREEGKPTRILSFTSVSLGSEGSITAIEDVTLRHAILTERERVAAFQEQMLGIVGHDLRTPINSVLAGAEVLQLQVTEPRTLVTVGRIMTSAKRMTSIVNQLLDVTRARLGEGIPVVFAAASLSSIVHAVTDELALSAPGRVVTELRDVVGRWDADRIQQVVSNLASNALQYGQADHPIKITAGPGEGIATISVANKNRGAPIPPERLAVLFDPYQRGHDNKLHREGLGLGLYIANEIVRAHNGRLSAVSTEAGTVFTVMLPLPRG